MRQERIPKVINYCWFGGHPLSQSAKKCIKSWEKFCPDYKIKQWNENNFDLNVSEYVKEAYKAKKWAFVADYARFWILYNYGGLYFDVDVELIKPINSVIDNGPFLGRESAIYDDYKFKTESQLMGLISNLNLLEHPNQIRNRSIYQYPLNPGLGMAVLPHMKFFKEMLKIYNTQHFLLKNKSYSRITIVDYTTALAKSYGISGTENKNIQHIKLENEQINVYPTEYFCPINYATNEINITSKTISIHHYSASWLTGPQKIEHRINIFCDKHKIKYKYKRMLTFPIRVIGKVQSLGIKNTSRFIINKVRHIHN